MTDTADRADVLLALATRCEAATGPDRELNGDLLEAFGGCAHRETKYYCIEDGNDTDSGFTCVRCRKDTYGQKVPAYTASLDTAMTLLPEGWRWWKAGDSASGGSRMVVTDTAEDGRFTLLGECPCPATVERNALALCAAAIRALATQKDQA